MQNLLLRSVQKDILAKAGIQWYRYNQDRIALTVYQACFGIGLFHDSVTDLSSKIVRMMNITLRIRRIDSLMIEANIKLSHAELLYAFIKITGMTFWLTWNIIIIQIVLTRLFTIMTALGQKNKSITSLVMLSRIKNEVFNNFIT